MKILIALSLSIFVSCEPARQLEERPPLRNGTFYLFVTNNPPFASRYLAFNEPSDFIQRLDEPLVFTDWENYEVGLVELRFKKDWKNVHTDQVIEMTTKEDIYAFKPMFLKAKHYDKIEDLVDDLNDLIVFNRINYKFIELPSFAIDYFSKRVILRTGKCRRSILEFTEKRMRQLFENYDCFPILSQHLSEMLGFVDENGDKFTEKNSRKFRIAETIPYPERNAPNISLNDENYIKIYHENKVLLLQKKTTYKTYEALQKHELLQHTELSIFSNIYEKKGEENSAFGLAKLDIPKNTTFNENVVISVRDPVYRGIGREFFHSISIQIKDQKGRFIKFNETSTVWAVLKFRNARESVHTLLH